MTTPRDLRDDDALLAVVGRALAHDPAEAGDDVAVPDEAVAVARAAFQLRDIDEELAELVHDSLLDEPMLVRHEATLNRLLSYVSSRLGLDVELEADGRTLMGVVTPAGPADVEIETATTIDRTSADELGRFRVELPPAGAGSACGPAAPRWSRRSSFVDADQREVDSAYAPRATSAEYAPWPTMVSRTTIIAMSASLLVAGCSSARPSSARRPRRVEVARRVRVTLTCSRMLSRQSCTRTAGLTQFAVVNRGAHAGSFAVISGDRAVGRSTGSRAGGVLVGAPPATGGAYRTACERARRSGGGTLVVGSSERAPPLGQAPDLLGGHQHLSCLPPDQVGPAADGVGRAARRHRLGRPRRRRTPYLTAACSTAG